MASLGAAKRGVGKSKKQVPGGNSSTSAPVSKKAQYSQKKQPAAFTNPTGDAFTKRCW